MDSPIANRTRAKQRLRLFVNHSHPRERDKSIELPSPLEHNMYPPLSPLKSTMTPRSPFESPLGHKARWFGGKTFGALIGVVAVGLLFTPWNMNLLGTQVVPNNATHHVHTNSQHPFELLDIPMDAIPEHHLQGSVEDNSYHPVEENDMHSTVVNLPNLALHSLGATIDRHATSPTFTDRKLFDKRNTPEKVLEGIPSVLVPGDSWGMLGTIGQLRINFPTSVAISAVSISHPALSTLPNYSRTAAPRYFSVKCGRHDDGHLWTSPKMEFTKLGHTQYFLLNQPDQQALHCDYLDFKFVENMGNPMYTSIYRIGAYGDLAI
ncbi:hypothetical protein P9112_007522 [Eukaryota sp. TZLM1-RC]